MFAKPYKLKSTNTLKNSEKKRLAQRILEEFSGATEEKVKDLVPGKSSTSCLKLVLRSGEIVAVYTVDNVPMIIETEAGLVPTVCALWKVPDLVPSITIHTPVLGKILGGAPLYLPGVVIPPGGAGFPQFPQGTVVSAHTTDNSAAGVVGRTAIGSGDMLMRSAGVCFETLHVYGDQLCKEGKFSKIERPKLSPTVYSEGADLLANSVSELTITQQTQPIKEEWPALGRPRPAATPVAAPTPASTQDTPELLQDPPEVVQGPTKVPNEPKLIPDDTEQDGDVLNDSVNSETQEDDEKQIPSDMDGLLRWAVLCWLRLKGRTVELPLKTNLLYRNQLVPLCPGERALDVKKSTYKKMGKFLEAMQREGLLEVKEIEKGVDAVVSVNVSHPAVRATRVPAALRESLAQAQEGEKEKEDYEPPLVREMLCVTAAVTQLFSDVKKGTALTAQEVRAKLTEYVKMKQLTSESKGCVTLDAVLAKVTGKTERESLKWDVLMSSVTSKMTPATEMRWPSGEVKLSKTRLEPVSMQVVTRSGNKKVTLVNNLEVFGFYLPALSVVCQRGAGASCGVTRSPGAKADQLILQGDQTHFVAKLLIDKYGLPKKFIDGADKALSKKK